MSRKCPSSGKGFSIIQPAEKCYCRRGIRGEIDVLQQGLTTCATLRRTSPPTRYSRGQFPPTLRSGGQYQRIRILPANAGLSIIYEKEDSPADGRRVFLD